MHLCVFLPLRQLTNNNIFTSLPTLLVSSVLLLVEARTNLALANRLTARLLQLRGRARLARPAPEQKTVKTMSQTGYKSANYFFSNTSDLEKKILLYISEGHFQKNLGKLCPHYSSHAHFENHGLRPHSGGRAPAANPSGHPANLISPCFVVQKWSRVYSFDTSRRVRIENM